MIHFKQPIAIIEPFVASHRAFLADGYQKGFFVVSGPRVPRTGGIVLSQLKDKFQVEQLFKQDPYYLNQLADYEFIEFDPVLYHQDFSLFV